MELRAQKDSIPGSPAGAHLRSARDDGPLGEVLRLQRAAGNDAVSALIVQRAACEMPMPQEQEEGGAPAGSPTAILGGPGPPLPPAAPTTTTDTAKDTPATTASGGTAAPAKTEAAADAPTLKVVDHGSSSAASAAATSGMNEVLTNLQAANAKALKGQTIELHIIPQDKKLTELDEYKYLAGTKTFDGRDYSEIRGAGGARVNAKLIRYAIAEEQVTPISGKASGYAMGFVQSHESGHVVHDFGLTDDQKKEMTKAFDARTKAAGPWLAPASYTSANENEYFAQCTAAWFGHPYSSSDDDKKTYTREWLKSNDAAMHTLLGKIYSK